MKKNFIYIFLIIILFLILIYSKNIEESILFSFNICINNLFPSIIPFMLISNIISNYELESNFIFNKITSLFKLSNNCFFIIIISLISGTPSNTKYICDLYNNNKISIEDAKKCIYIFEYSSPIFIINTVGISFLNSKKLGIIILLSNILSSFILTIFNKKSNNIYNYNKINNENIIIIIKRAIESTINTLLLILGIITTCLIITTIIDSIFNIPNNYKYLYGLFEITQGLKYLEYTNYSNSIKALISCFLISFGGFSIHMQVFSLINNKKIKYTPYLLYRIIHGILSSLICYIIIL